MKKGEKTRTIVLTAPRGWGELNEWQLKYAAWLLCQGDMAIEEIWTYAFVRFARIKLKSRAGEGYVFRFKGRLFLLSDQECLFFAKRFRYLTDGIEEVMPLARMRGRKAGDARLRGTSLAQYLACENYYQAFLFTKEERFLNMLCASFYVRGKDFDDSKTEKESLCFAGLPFHERYTVFLWFTGLKKVLRRHFSNYFVAMDADEEDAPAAPNMRKHIEQMMRTLSGGDVTKVRDVYGVETWTALAELDGRALEYKTMKQIMKK